MATQSRIGSLNIPNSLSLVRILTAPVLVLLLLSPAETLSVVSAVLFVLVCITDWLDGYIARKYNQTTALGKFLDPLADKLLITTAFIMLIPLGRVPAWVVALMLSREMAVTGLRAMAATSGKIISASWLGKLKTVSQIVCLVPLMLHYKFYGIDFQAIGSLLLVLSFVLTIWSGIDYFIRFLKSDNLA